MNPSEVLLWQWDLDDPSLADAAVLSADEVARASRFVVPQAARRFTAGRAALRQTLATLCGRTAAGLVVQTAGKGKPFIQDGPHFNLAHSGPVALFAVAAFPIGVDVEAVRAVEPGLAGLVFTPAELAYQRELPDADRVTAFFRGWTRKEAVIKAQGGSIADLQTIGVLPDCTLPGWQVTDLTAATGYAAAVAANAQGWTVTRQGLGSGA